MVDPKYIVNLKGKPYPMWGGILDAATRAGLKLLTTDVVQIPSPENGYLAVVMATAEFEDGRTFTDVGDCSPQSTSPRLAPAALRLASTRAKGRCLRDALNIGETMFEELPGEGDRDEEERVVPPRAVNNGHPQAAEQGFCQEPGCGVELTPGQRTMSVRRFGQPLCPAHQAGKAVTTTTA